MNPNDYVDLAVNTEAPITDKMRNVLGGKRTIRLLHAGMGMCTEAGEFKDDSALLRDLVTERKVLEGEGGVSE